MLLDTGDGNYIELFAGGTRLRGQEPPEGALLHMAFRTADCDSALARARSAGAVVTMEPTTVSVPGQPARDFRIAFVKGPDGEILEFFQNPDL
jgi:glyoxylase I family protein